MLFHVANLKTLHLYGFHTLNDDHIAELMAGSLVLTDLSLKGMNFASLSAEAMCSHVPNVSKLSISHSKTFGDLELRCISSTCQYLRELTVQYCPSMTDNGFARCPALKRLSKLDISNCSPAVTGACLSCFTTSPLKILNISGNLWNSIADKLDKLSPFTKLNVEELHLRALSNINERDILYVLNSFSKCRLFDLSTNYHIYTTLHSIENPHPLLSLWRPGDVMDSSNAFIGYKVNAEERHKYYQTWAIFEHIKKHRAAKKLQKLRRKYLEKLELYRKQRADALLAKRIKVATWVQSIYRMQRVRRVFLRHLYAGRRIVRGARRWFKFRYYRRLRQAKHHYHLRIQRLLFLLLLDNVEPSINQLKLKSHNVQRRVNHNYKRKIYDYMVKRVDEERNNRFNDSVLVLWEEKILKKIFQSWKLIVGDSKPFRRTFRLVIPNTLQLSHYNSANQNALAKMAENFHYRKMLCTAWLSLGDEFMRAKVAEMFIPKAIAHFKYTFFHRMVGGTYGSLKYYWESKVLKRRTCEYAERFRLNKIRNIPLQQMKTNAKAMKKYKNDISRAIPVFVRSMYRILMKRLPVNTLVTKYFKELDDVSYLHWRDWYTKTGFKDLQLGCIRSKEFRELMYVGEHKAFIKYTKWTFGGWKAFVLLARDFESYYYRYYLLRVAKQIIGGFRKAVEISKAHVKQLQEQMSANAANAARLEEIIKYIIRFQARVRGSIARKLNEERKFKEFYAIGVMQCFARQYLARKVLQDLLRKEIMMQKSVQFRELELMTDAEIETRYYLYKVKHAIEIQRVFRGWKGRERGAILAKEIVYDKSKRFYDEMLQVRNSIEARRRANELREKKRNNAATLIQKRVRGMQARKRLVGIKREALRTKYTIWVQRNYRKKLGILKLDALRRAKVSALRYLAAKQERGMIIRMFGFKKRHQQKFMSSLLDGLGMDPITFHYRIPELLRETYEDMMLFFDICKREFNIFKEGKGNKIYANIKRTEILEAQGYKLQTFDPVMIIDERNPFYGCTGIVVRIDTSIPGVPLIEVKIDGKQQQGFVMMTLDALQAYTKPQPLAKVKRKPVLTGFKQPFVVFGLSEDDPFYQYKNVVAAWTIQRAFRMHRARKITARKRYELWVRSGDIQNVLFNCLSDSNSLTTQAYNMYSVLGFQPKRPVFYDEIRHPVLPPRFIATATKVDEKVSLKQEFDAKIADRLVFLEKCAVRRGRDFFGIGNEKFTRYRKLKLLFRKLCGFRKVEPNPNNPNGNMRLVEGMNSYMFSQFYGSPHVRYSKQFLYQGQWSGVPLLTPLTPHGLGVLIFMDGWGFAKEDKVLYLTINKCRYLNAMDMSTSDPFCRILCNGSILETSVKWQNLNPDFYESFEIDVTNPTAKCEIIVFDKDYIGSDDFMGKIVLNLADYADGKERTQTFLLKDEELTADEDFDRGEIEVRVQWSERKFEDDMERDKKRVEKATKLAAWARRIAAKELRKKMAKEYQDLMAMVRKKATMITSICRIRLSRKQLRKMLRRNRAALKIQKRVRIRQAKQKFKKRKTRWYAAVKIQALMRGCLARMQRKKAIKGKREALDASATCIQKWVRRLIAQIWRINQLQAKKQADAEVEEEELDYEVEVKKVRSKDWLPYYGTDLEYGLRRNRRMITNAFQRMLKQKYVRLLTKTYGICYVESYPGPTLEGGLTEPNDFIVCYLPSFQPNYITHRNEAIEKHFNPSPHLISLHVPTQIKMRETVEYAIKTIQCKVRQMVAIKEKKAIMKLHTAISKFQKIFRRRNERLQKAAINITALFRLIAAKARTGLRRLERKSAIILQCAYRCHVARKKEIDIRSVKKITLLKCSSSVPNHGGEKALEHRMHTYWITDDPEYGEIRVELEKIECITDLWIMTSTFEASPQSVIISTVTSDDKIKKTYTTLVRAELALLKGERWHKFKFNPPPLSKYFKLLFRGNNGDPKHLSVRQIRFLRSKEISATILKQPEHQILTAGPMLGDRQSVVLNCEATGWPKPTFQWYKGSKPIAGATNPTLSLTLMCAPTKKCRNYRCVKCKMICKRVPVNAYHTKCSNCSYLFSYKEIEEYDLTISGVHKDEAMLVHEVQKLLETKEQLEGKTDAQAFVMYNDTVNRLKECNDAIQLIKEARYSAKIDLKYTNKFTDEGIYTCYVQNYRGGDLVSLTKSVRTVVVVEHSIPYLVRVRPEYIPRAPSIRKKWTTYNSIYGTFKKGRVEGIVTICYNDGSAYEGPYVGEEFLDTKGRVIKPGRAKDHYGVFRAPDGRTFEGPLVDNHFDVNNLQDFYRVRMKNGEVYEGMFLDENYHGVGMYTFKDGSVYEGLWFRGFRFGHGHFRSAEGWAYEGFFDNNRRHLDGFITYKDGSMYMGEWYYDTIQGKGIHISQLRDVYRGEFKDGLYEGYGQLVYSNGSIHTGKFKEGKRQGRGIFSPIDGCEYYGQYVDDELHGEVIIKQTINVEQKGQDFYDIRIGLYDNGHFVKYLSKASNPLATKEFISLFKHNRGMFDSVYSMILAKNLPKLPDGVDQNNDEVRDIIFRIRSEAGGLLGAEAIVQAQQRVESLMKPVTEKKAEIKRLTDEIDQLGMKAINIDRDMAVLERKFSYLFTVVDRANIMIEQFWFDEKTESRAKFNIVCAKLKNYNKDQYFEFRNHRVPPPFVKKILNAISYIMGWGTDFKRQILLVSDNIYNGRMGEEDALRFEYECKLIHLMKDFKVYDHLKYLEDPAVIPLFDAILADPRFRPDSYYVESCGVVGPVLVEWVLATRRYILASKALVSFLKDTEEKKLNAFRLKANYTKLGEELKQSKERSAVAKVQLARANEDLNELQLFVLQAQDTLSFVMEGLDTKKITTRTDYFELLERKIEENRNRFDIETALEFCVHGVEKVYEDEKQQAMRLAKANGVVYVEPVVAKPLIKDWLVNEIKVKQNMLLEDGRTLGYAFENDHTALTYEETLKYIDICVDLTIGNMNEVYNDFSHMRQWRMLNGKLVTARFLYIHGWRIWENLAVGMEEDKAITAWESVFTTAEECAMKALEAKVNERMAAAAREQGRIWAKRHPLEIEYAEQVLADAFEKEFPSTEQNELKTARSALEISESLSGTEHPPEMKAKCMAWIRLNPSLMLQAKDEYHLSLAEKFKAQFKDAATACFNIMNGLLPPEQISDYDWHDYADHWRAFNLEEYKAVSDKKVDEMANSFKASFPEFTHKEAARILYNERIGKYIQDPEVLAELQTDASIIFNASCYRTRNQGMVRAAMEQIEHDAKQRGIREWISLTEVTENFRKGSYMSTPPEAQKDPSLDRFKGFRDRLLNIHAWFYGYLCKQQEDKLLELEKAEYMDPFTKTQHRIRPTEEKKVLKETDEKYVAMKRRLESEVHDIFTKLSTWNTYFGWVESATEDITQS